MIRYFFFFSYSSPICDVTNDRKRKNNNNGQLNIVVLNKSGDRQSSGGRDKKTTNDVSSKDQNGRSPSAIILPDATNLNIDQFMPMIELISSINTIAAAAVSLAPPPAVPSSSLLYLTCLSWNPRVLYRSQEPTIVPYTEPQRRSSNIHNLIYKNHFNIILQSVSNFSQFVSPLQYIRP
jgi:hypothetical protein